jgi:hypothetical protein
MIKSGFHQLQLPFALAKPRKVREGHVFFDDLRLRFSSALSDFYSKIFQPYITHLKAFPYAFADPIWRDIGRISR